MTRQESFILIFLVLDLRQKNPLPMGVSMKEFVMFHLAFSLEKRSGVLIGIEHFARVSLPIRFNWQARTEFRYTFSSNLIAGRFPLV